MLPLAHPTSDELYAYLLGRLSLARLDEVAGHLETCGECEAAVETLDGRADSLMAQLAVPAGVAEFEQESELARALDQAQRTFAGDSLGTQPETVIRQLRDYQLLEKLGEGGMGAVYKARHARLKKLVAVKVLPADRLSDARAVARFQREMEAVGTLEHPHIVRAFDAGEHDGTHYLVMEYVEGHDLSTLVRRHGPLPVADACELVRQAALGLQYAHEHGLVHRDIKPSNLMLSPVRSAERGVGSDEHSALRAPRSALLKILDLGLALLHSEDGELTASGQMMGTLDYMAPEQGGDSHLVDIRADIYSLGATLYKLLTGEAPFAGGNRTHIQSWSPWPPSLRRRSPRAARTSRPISAL